MRISLVVPRYLPHVGGIENHVAAIAQSLQSRGHQVTVATQLEGADLPRTERSDTGLCVERFPSTLRVRGQGISPALRNWVGAGAGGADVVHLHNFHALTTLACALTTPSAPLVLTPHYLGPRPGRAEAVAHAVHALSFRRALRDVTGIVCVSRSEALSFAARVGYGDRVTVIPNGVDDDALRTAVPVEHAGRLLVVAGRMEEYKQPHLVLDALRHLPADYSIAFVGDGPALPGLRRQADLWGLAGRVDFPGRQSPERVYGWYRAAEVVISLSRRECFGMTIAEGLAAGAAVVASDIGPHRDVVADVGSSAAAFVPREVTPAALATAIRSVKPDRGQQSPIRATTWADVTSRTEALYESVLDGSGHP